MNMEKEILAWDGKSAADIAKIFHLRCDEPLFIGTLIKLMEVTACQKGATWLLKAWFKSDQSITPEQASKIISHLGILEDWEAKLHILQCLPSLSIKPQQKLSVEKFLRTTLLDKNKFIRAWSYNGFYELANQYPEYQDEAKQFFEMAMRDEAASVKARVRNIMKNGI